MHRADPVLDAAFTFADGVHVTGEPAQPTVTDWLWEWVPPLSDPVKKGAKRQVRPAAQVSLSTSERGRSRPATAPIAASPHARRSSVYCN